jgi:hypothetical protein
MIVAELTEKVEITEILSDEQKDQWLNLLPHMNAAQLRGLAQLLLWAEDQDHDLAYEGDEVVYRVTAMFTSMNKTAVIRAKKEYFRDMETEQRSQDEEDTIELLRQLK